MKTAITRKIPQSLEPIDIIYPDKNATKHKKTYWNFDKYGIALGLNIHVKTRISFAPLMIPSGKIKSVKFCYYFLNPKKELFTTRMYMKDFSGKLRILPIMSSKNEVGVVELDIPPEITNSNIPLCFSALVAVTKPIYIKNFWIEFEVEDAQNT
jgi:hypothetical protein